MGAIIALENRLRQCNAKTPIAASSLAFHRIGSSHGSERGSKQLLSSQRRTRIVLDTVRGDVDEDIRNYWQRMTYRVIEVVHRPCELLNSQVRQWTDFRYDDHLFRR